MTGTIGGMATSRVIHLLTGTGGMSDRLAALAGADRVLAGSMDVAQVRAQNVSPDLAERSGSTKYPAVHIYCEKVSNSLKEKFRSFSGRVEMAIEIRHSQDRLEGLQDQLELYTDAATGVLDSARGDWGGGMFYGGGFEVTFGAVKHGGSNFIQVAKVTFKIGVSRS